MSFDEKKMDLASSLSSCTDIAKDILSIGHVEDAEDVLIVVLSLGHSNEAQTLLEQIRAEKLKIKPNKPVLEPIETDFETERQKQLEIEARNEIEKAQYAEMKTNRFKMRAKVLSLEVAVILKDYENDTGNGSPPPRVTVSTAIENLLVKVQDAIITADLGKAEKHLIEAERIYHKENANIPKNIKTKHNSKPPVTEAVRKKHIPAPREKAALKGNEGDEIRSILIAKAAINDKDYVKAERFLLRAERLNPTEVAKKLLQVVRNMASKNESTEHRDTINNDKCSQNEHFESPSNKPAKDSDTDLEDKHRLAEKIIKLAKTSIDDGNYERAKQMLEKAEQLFPTTAAKDLLQEIEENKAKKKTSDSLLDKLCKLLSFANKAEAEGDLHMSQKYLENAQEIFPEHEEVNEKLLKIRSAKTKDTGTEEPAKPVATTDIPDTSIILEETYAKARAAMAQGRYDAAENMILHLKENIPDVNVDGILSEIRADRASRSSSEGMVIGGKVTYAQMCDKTKQTCDNYYKIAENAIKEGDLFKAQDYLLLASKFNSGEPVISLLNHVQERISSGGNKTQQEETINETKKAEALKHIDNAHKAFTDGCLDKAEQLLLEALELQPDEETKKVLNDVKAAKVAISNQTSRLRSGYAWRNHSSATNQQSSVMHEEPVITDPGMNPENRESSQQTGPTKTLEKGSNTKQNMSASNQTYNNESTPEYSSTYRVNVLSVNQVQSQTYIDMAKQAFSNRNYDQAEELVLKSQEQSPSDEATELLKEIRLAKTLAFVKEDDTEMNVNYDKKMNTQVPSSDNFETIDDLRRKDAETSAKIAQIALSEGDLEKAERLLLKAERIFPTEQAKTLLEDVSLKKKTRNVKENKDKSLTSPVSDDVDNLIKIAFEHIDKKDFHTAESFFYTAKMLLPSDYNADYLQQVRDAIKDQEAYSMPEKKGKKHKKEINRQEEADKHVCIAKEALRVNDFVKAEGNLVVASSLHPSKTADELLKKVRDASKKRYMPTPTNSNSAPVEDTIEDLNDFKSDEYIRMAQNAIDIENYVLAEHFLSKAQMLSPSVHADYLLGKVVAKKNEKESKSSSWYSGYFNK